MRALALSEAHLQFKRIGWELQLLRDLIALLHIRDNTFEIWCYTAPFHLISRGPELLRHALVHLTSMLLALMSAILLPLARPS